MMLLTTAGAFCAFSLMTIAVGTDYWLYSRGMCRSKNLNDNETVHKNEEVLTHSGLWRTCCTEGDPSQSDNKKSYSYGWSFYFGALSFVLAEMVGVLAVHVFIEKHRQLRTKGRPSLMKPPISRNPSSYRNRYYQNRSRRYSYRSNHSVADSTSPGYQTSLVRDQEASISDESKVTTMAGLPTPMMMGSEFMLYALTSPLKESKINMDVEDLTTAATHNTNMLPGNCVSNRRTTPV
ncbi:hypothetical protein XENOCAPTIV_021233 [Xenoophorus captivus]|uniref:Voltage-dependent calcium channel gamma-3 subunit n=1 Tax=Xenoophorus captivus TaxID=1517983 RepID=A0ABV0RUD9_9TELE